MTEPEFLKTTEDINAWRQRVAAGGESAGAVVRKEFVSDVEVHDDRTVKFIITTGSADREKDVIDPAGWDVSSYLKNPVVLFAHDYDSLPVARTVSLKQHGDQLIAVAEFASAELNPMAEQVYQMLRQGFLKGASVGFRPLAFTYNEARGGVDFSKQELLEFSVVPIPANAQALMAAGVKSDAAVQWTQWAKAMLKALEPEALQVKQPGSEQLDDFLDVIRKMMNEIKVAVRETIRQVDEFQNTGAYGEDDGDEEAGVELMSVSSLVARGIAPENVSEKTAPMDESWSRPSLGDFADKPWEDLSSSERRKIAGHFAWATSEEPEAFGDMKLPHHRAADGYVVWRGIVAASGRLDQTDFPSEDMGAVKSHLAAHFKEFDRVAPWERDASSWAAFTKARNRRAMKRGEPLHDTDIAGLLDDYGFEDEAVALVLPNKGTAQPVMFATSPSLDEDDEVGESSPDLAAVLRSVGVVHERVQELAARLDVDRSQDDVVLELDSDGDLVVLDESEERAVADTVSVDVDPSDLSDVMREAMREAVGTVVGAEMRSAINAMRGRLD